MQTLRTLTGDGATTLYPIDFNNGYLDQSHIYVYQGEVGDYQTQLAYSWPNDTQIELDEPVPNGETFYIRRVVPVDALIHDYSDGAILREKELDQSHLQALMKLEEFQDNLGDNAGVFNLDALGKQIVNLARGTQADHAVNLEQVLELLNADITLLNTFDSLAEAQSADLTLFNTVEIKSINGLWQGTEDGPEGWTTCHRDGTTGTPSTGTIDQWYDSEGNGYRKSAEQKLSPDIEQKANDADANATQALADAATALATANTAQTTADNAQSTADSAQTAANNAQSTANTANSTANSANTRSLNNETTLNNLDLSGTTLSGSQTLSIEHTGGPTNGTVASGQLTIGSMLINVIRVTVPTIALNLKPAFEFNLNTLTGCTAYSNTNYGVLASAGTDSLLEADSKIDYRIASATNTAIYVGEVGGGGSLNLETVTIVTFGTKP